MTNFVDRAFANPTASEQLKLCSYRIGSVVAPGDICTDNTLTFAAPSHVTPWSVLLQVNYYGVPTPLKQVAGISVPDASTLLISPYDKSALKDIEKAINESDVGINPNNDGEKIRLNIPPMTQVRLWQKSLANFS